MIYNFRCTECGDGAFFDRPMSKGPPQRARCECGAKLERDWQADRPHLDTSGCKDADDIPAMARVHDDFSCSPTDSRAKRKEAAFQRQLQQRRTRIREAGGQRGTFRQTHQIPADLYHGKKRQTGDKDYWKDPKNLNRHKSCKVD